MPEKDLLEDIIREAVRLTGPDADESTQAVAVMRVLDHFSYTVRWCELREDGFAITYGCPDCDGQYETLFRTEAGEARARAAAARRGADDPTTDENFR